MTPAEKIHAFLDDDMERLADLVDKNPIHIKTKDVADFLHMSERSVLAAVDNGELGLSWMQDGKGRKTRRIFTAKFVRWYLNERM